MIVCHKHQFIFIKTQKTAGTSLEIALSQLCGKGDIVTPISKNDEEYRQSLGFQAPMNYIVPFSKYKKADYINLMVSKRRKELYNHMSCSEIKGFLGRDIYNSYYKFCFERNPYDKVISLFFHEGGFDKWTSIKSFIQSGGLAIIRGFDQYTIDKIVAVDDIFKFEEMDNALETISKKLNLEKNLKMPERKLKSEFRKDKAHYREILSISEKELIDVIWARERELMNYQF